MTDPSDRCTPWALFLDFDGTLVDIAERPDAVVVEPAVPEALALLSRRLEGALAIVSGRTIRSVTEFLGEGPFDICGMHGLERRVGGLVSRPDGLADLSSDVDALRRAFAGRPGILVEDKGVGVALHWRMAPEAEDEALAAMAALAARLGDGYRIQDGKAVREIVPAASGKGGAIEALMAAPPYRGRIPVFAGDDRTDESGFEAVNGLGGISLKLGPGPTAAGRRLPSAAAFRTWLGRWAEGQARPDDLPAA